MPVEVKTNAPTMGEVLKWEQEHRFCRKVVTVLSGRKLTIGSVIGSRRVDPTAANVTAAAVGGNTGNGTITKDATTPALAGAKPGVYTAVCVAGATNGGTFVVYRPDGSIVGFAKVGVAFATEVKFTIADGATDFVPGDAFIITVPAGDGKVVLAPFAAAAEGWHQVDGVLLETVDATSADKQGLALFRGPSIVAAGLLLYEAGYDNNTKKAAAQAALRALGIEPAVTV